MGQLGRYTTYVGGGASPAHALLATLYPSNPLAKMLSNGDEIEAQKAVLAVATSDPGLDPNGGGIQPKGGTQAGDLGMFPTGVDLTFKGSPDISKVKWAHPGDPANGYIPDITSPTAGPGHTAGADKTGDPTGTIPQLVATATTEDPGSQTAPFNEAQGTRDPSNVGPSVSGNNKLGQPQTPGNSGGNV
jgi:hypothetical protein